MQNNVIEIDNLSLPYSFQNFNLSIERNKLTAITGSNNCGKTTLLKCILGQIFTDNTIYIFSQQLEYYRITELNIIIKSIIPHEYLFMEETPLQELKFSLNKSELSYEIKQKKIKDIIKKLKLTKIQNKEINNLSETEKIKVELAKVLLQEPKVLLLDDIFLNMKKQDKENIFDILREYQDNLDLTIIMTTSNLEDCLNSDYMYVIDKNTIVLEGKPVDVLEKDNILNRVGLELPFIIDLSVKLRDYDLINDIDLTIDIDRMVEELWK